MCLTAKYERRFPGNKGWKLLRREDGRYFTGFCDAERIEVTKDKFAKADTIPINSELTYSSSSTAGTYPGGFHIFTRKVDAIAVQKSAIYPLRLLCRVEFRKQVAFGTIRWSSGKLSKLSTVVAQQCKIIEVIGE